MKILKKALKKKTGYAEGSVVLLPENIDDLWYLYRIVEKGDTIKGRSHRVYKPTEAAKPERKPVTVVLNVEKIEFSEYSKSLRMTGKVIMGYPEEFVQRGAYHTLDVELHSTLTITKEWLLTQLKLLDEAVKRSKIPVVLIVVLDEEKALFAEVKPRGIEYLHEIYSNASKREGRYDERIKGYLTEITNWILRFNGPLVIGGPGFVKDMLKNKIDNDHPEIKQRVIYEPCAHAERNGIKELIKRGVIDRVIGRTRLAEEERVMDEFKMHLGKDTGKVVYGFDAVQKALEYGALERLVILDALIREDRMRRLVSNAEERGVKVIFFSDEDPPGQELRGFSGIIGFLHYPLPQ